MRMHLAKRRLLNGQCAKSAAECVKRVEECARCATGCAKWLDASTMLIDGDASREFQMATGSRVGKPFAARCGDGCGRHSRGVAESLCTSPSEIPGYKITRPDSQRAAGRVFD